MRFLDSLKLFAATGNAVLEGLVDLIKSINHAWDPKEQRQHKRYQCLRRITGSNKNCDKRNQDRQYVPKNLHFTPPIALVPGATPVCLFTQDD